jgi:hypothetical protein
MIDNLTKIRYSKVLEGLTDLWIPKLTLSIVSTGLASFFDLVYTEPFLIIAVIIAMLGDVITGITASIRRKQPITSVGLRQFATKVVEYAVVLLFFTVMSNAFGANKLDNWVGSFLGVLENIHYVGYWYVMMTEGLSIWENLNNGESRAADVFEYIKNKIDDKIND